MKPGINPFGSFEERERAFDLAVAGFTDIEKKPMKLGSDPLDIDSILDSIPKEEISDHRKVLEKYSDKFSLSHEKSLNFRKDEVSIGGLALTFAMADPHHIELHGLSAARELSMLGGTQRLTNAIHMIGQHMTDKVDARIAQLRRDQMRRSQG